MQGLQEAQKAAQASQMMVQVLGPQGAAAGIAHGYQTEDVATWILEKLNVDPKIIRDEQSRQQQMKYMQQQAQVQQQQFWRSSSSS